MIKFLMLTLVLLLSCTGIALAQTTNQTQSGNQGSSGNPTAPVQSL